jgi:hypothetical protein
LVGRAESETSIAAPPSAWTKMPCINPQLVRGCAVFGVRDRWGPGLKQLTINHSATAFSCIMARFHEHRRDDCMLNGPQRLRVDTSAHEVDRVMSDIQIDAAKLDSLSYVRFQDHKDCWPGLVAPQEQSVVYKSASIASRDRDGYIRRSLQSPGFCSKQLYFTSPAFVMIHPFIIFLLALQAAAVAEAVTVKWTLHWSCCRPSTNIIHSYKPTLTQLQTGIKTIPRTTISWPIL